MPITELSTTEEITKEEDDFSAAFGEAVDSVPGVTEDTAVENRSGVKSKSIEEEAITEHTDETIDKVDETIDDPNAEVIKKLTPSTDEDKTDYEELYKKEKQRNDSWEGRISAANKKAEKAEKDKERLTAELEEARTQSKGLKLDITDSDSGELMEEFDKEYPDLKRAITIIATAVAKEIALDLISKNLPDIKPLEQRVEQLTEDIVENEREKHIRLMTEAHPDQETIVRGGYLRNWIQTEPTHKQVYLREAYERGNTQQVIDLLTDFKKSTGWKTNTIKQLTNTNQKSTKEDDKLNSMMNVEGDHSPLPPGETKADANDFSSAFAEATSRK